MQMCLKKSYTLYTWSQRQIRRVQPVPNKLRYIVHETLYKKGLGR